MKMRDRRAWPVVASCREVWGEVRGRCKSPNYHQLKAGTSVLVFAYSVLQKEPLLLDKCLQVT